MTEVLESVQPSVSCVKKLQTKVDHIRNGWTMANMFLATQMFMSTDTEGNLVIESFNYLPEA